MGKTGIRWKFLVFKAKNPSIYQYTCFVSTGLLRKLILRLLQNCFPRRVMKRLWIILFQTARVTFWNMQNSSLINFVHMRFVIFASLYLFILHLLYRNVMTYTFSLLQKSYHYISLLKSVMRLSLTSLKGADAKEVASSITAIANEKIKAEKEANASKKKTGLSLLSCILH